MSLITIGNVPFGDSGVVGQADERNPLRKRLLWAAVALRVTVFVH